MLAAAELPLREVFGQRLGRFDLLRLLQGFLGHVSLPLLICPAGHRCLICKTVAKVHKQMSIANNGLLLEIATQQRSARNQIRSPGVELLNAR